MPDRQGEKRHLSKSLQLAIDGDVINYLSEQSSLPEPKPQNSLSPEEQRSWQSNRSFVTHIIQSEIPNFPERLLQMRAGQLGIAPNQFCIKLEGMAPQDREFWDKLILAPRLSSLHRKWEKDSDGHTLFLEISRSQDGNSINCSVGRMKHEVVAFDPQQKALDKRMMIMVQKELLAPLGISDMIISAKSYEEYTRLNSTVPNSIYMECIVKHENGDQLDGG